jgi:hypothetical protein
MLWSDWFFAVFSWRFACGDTWDSAFAQAARVADFMESA